MIGRCVLRSAAALLGLLLCACDKQEAAQSDCSSVPEGMVEIRPVLPARLDAIPRSASEAARAATRAYDTEAETERKLAALNEIRLPDGSTVWLIAKNTETGKFEKNSYVVHNSDAEVAETSFLYPCKVDPEGHVISSQGTPLYLKSGETYLFYALSPARALDEAKFEEGEVAFQIKNGQAFYANDGRYDKTFPLEADRITVGKGPGSDQGQAVQRIELKPMINQTAQLKFQIVKDEAGHVHDLGIQPSGIQISGLQNDRITKENSLYGNADGLYWHMSQAKGDEPIRLQYSDQTGELDCYDYTIGADESVIIEVPILPMWGTSNPVFVLFRLKVNGVPSSYEMMLNEKDFKAGYSYGYRGTVSVEEGVTIISWQFVEWELDVELPVE